MSKIAIQFMCVVLSGSLFASGVMAAPVGAASTQPLPEFMPVMSMSTELPLERQLDQLALAEALTDQEAGSTEGGLPVTIIAALAGAASSMGAYMYGVLVKKKPFDAREFARRGGCGALVGILGRFIPGRSAALRILGSTETGFTLAACFG